MGRHSSGPVNNLLHWILDERVLKKLKGTGFDTLRGFNEHLRHNLPLINVLIKRYNTDTRSFIMGSAENSFTITYGLEDVLYITGLPINGKAVTGLDPEDTTSVCQQYLGKHEGYGKCGLISLKWLKENFMTVDENLTEEDDDDDLVLAYHVRAYVLYVLGCTFAPGSCLTVSSMFLPLLENVDDIGSYAWGAALLANIHDSIHDSAENPTKVLIGFYFPLMVFAYIRFPGLLSTFEIDRGAINEFPLVVSWSHALGEVMRHNYKNRNEENLETFFDNLKEEGGIGEEEVKWQPYAEFSRNFLPQHLREQVVLSKSRTILICFEKAVYHRPDKCQRQLGLAGHVLKGELIEIKTKRRTGWKDKNGTDWSKKGKYPDYISEWDKRFDLLIDRDANAAPDPAEASVTDGDENVAPEEAGSVHDDSRPFEEETHPDDTEASLIAVLRNENEKLKEEIELYRRKDVNRISCTIEEMHPDLMEKNASSFRVDNVVDDDLHSPGDTTSSRVRNSKEIRGCHTQEAGKKQRVSPSTTTTAAIDRAEPLIIVVNSDSDDDVSITKKQRVSPSTTTTTAAAAVDRAEPLIIDVKSESDSDDDVSITDSFMDALVS